MLKSGTMVSKEIHMKTEYAAKSSCGILALIPAYNEERFIGSVVLKARRYVADVIVIDDGSTDETAMIAEAAGARVLYQSHNQGKAAALNMGFEFARQFGATAVVVLDGDGQHSPNDIPALVQPILDGKADMVVGSRFMGVASNTPGWRIVGQHALTVATNAASGVALTDSQNGFRALSQKAIEHLRFRSQGFSVESEMQFLIKQHNLVVAEVPIAVNYDEKSKRNPVAHGLQVLNGILRMIGQHRPLFFFGVPGLLILIAGILWGLVVIDRMATYGVLATGYALVAVTLCITGMFSIFTGIILHTIRAYMTER